MAAKYLAFVLVSLAVVIISEDAPKRKYHEVTFEKYLKDAIALTVDTFNKIGSAKDGKIYDVVKLQISVKRLANSLWTYDRLEMALRETNCTEVNSASLENCVIVNEPTEPCKESTDRTKALKKQQYFGSSLTKIQEVKFDKYLQEAITLAVDTFNKIGNVNDGKLYDVVSIKTTVKRIDTDVWIYDRLEMTLRETNCTKILNSISLEGCVVIDDKQPMKIPNWNKIFEEIRATKLELMLESMLANVRQLFRQIRHLFEYWFKYWNRHRISRADIKSQPVKSTGVKFSDAQGSKILEEDEHN